MRYLILSDLHANWQALEAVLQASAGQYEQVLCCGDLIGYGGDPNAVVEWIRANVSVVVRGNHDKAAVGLEDLEWFNPVARAAALWTHQELSPENTEYVRNLPRGPIGKDGFQVTHGSPLDEDEYLISPADAAHVFSYLEAPVTFFGHTHVQGGFALSPPYVEVIPRPAAQAVDQRMALSDPCAYLINPGSVGQPRDGDPRAACILYEPRDSCVVYRRVAYDVEKAQRRIRQAGLPAVLADRLAAGR